MATALSGAEARGGGATDDRPYRESFTYDALGQMTARQTNQWDQNYDSTDNYLNNRHEGWLYDSDGRLTSGSTGAYVYDAAGAITSFGNSDPSMTDQQVDGDGRRGKATQRSYNDQTNQWTTDSVTYYVNGTVLDAHQVPIGERVVMEFFELQGVSHAKIAWNQRAEYTSIVAPSLHYVEEFEKATESPRQLLSVDHSTTIG